MRYFVTLAYKGTHFKGWQIQPNAPSVQEHIEQALSTILQENISITGCGRTDTGVHAKHFIAHFDTNATLPSTILLGLNALLSDEIAIQKIQPMHYTAHARFDAVSRSYEYHIITQKSPFLTELAWKYPQFSKIDFQKTQAVADLLLKYDTFFPFCKTNSGVDHYQCHLTKAQWVYDPKNNTAIFYISANRFLRGMVRLIVGACIQVGAGRLSIDEVRQALDNQSPMSKNLSVPPDGLFLTDIQYPYEV